MLTALLLEAAFFPHWFVARWIPQVSFLILLFAALKGGIRVGIVLGLTLGMAQSLFTAFPADQVIWVYAGLGAVAGAAKSLVFLESPIAQWLAPVGFGLLTELVFFWMMPWDENPLGFWDFSRMIRFSNLPVTWLLSGFVYAWCDRRLFAPKKA